MLYQIRKILKQINLELFFWTAGLIFLMIVNPNENHHFTFCVFKNIGIEFCPGCGLGRSISYLFRGDFISSIKAHPLGVPAILILSFRIAQLFTQTIVTIKNKLKES